MTVSNDLKSDLRMNQESHDFSRVECQLNQIQSVIISTDRSYVYRPHMGKPHVGNRLSYEELKKPAPRSVPVPHLKY